MHLPGPPPPRNVTARPPPRDGRAVVSHWHGARAAEAGEAPAATPRRARVEGSGPGGARSWRPRGRTPESSGANRAGHLTHLSSRLAPAAPGTRRRAAEPARPWRRALSRRRTHCFTSSPAGERPGPAPRPSRPALRPHCAPAGYRPSAGRRAGSQRRKSWRRGVRTPGRRRPFPLPGPHPRRVLPGACFAPTPIPLPAASPASNPFKQLERLE